MMGQIRACLMLLMVLAGPDPAALVAQLGSDRPGEREAAVRALVELGREALVPLRAACSDKNPEIRARAAEVWRTIAKRLMVEPTMVRLDLTGRSPDQAIAAIHQQTGISLSFARLTRQRTITLHEPAPLPLWQALDRLDFGTFMIRYDSVTDHEIAELVLDDQEVRAPVSSSGPFQVELTAIRDHRACSFAGAPWVRVDDINQRIPIRGNEPPSVLRFFADLHVWDRGRRDRLVSAPPPSEPCRRISRTRLSSQWFYLEED